MSYSVVGTSTPANMERYVSDLSTMNLREEVRTSLGEK